MTSLAGIGSSSQVALANPFQDSSAKFDDAPKVQKTPPPPEIKASSYQAPDAAKSETDAAGQRGKSLDITV